MADEVTPDTSTIGSPAFQAADAFTAREEGGKTLNDGTGHAAAYGIDQSAHPGIDVSSLTPAQAQAIRHQYWTAINGDAIAKIDPKLALVAYDTAIMAGPAKAQEFLVKSDGNPSAFMQLRSEFLNHLVAQNPERYGPVAQGWAARDKRLAETVGGVDHGGYLSASAWPNVSLTQFPVKDAPSFLQAADQAVQKTAQAAPAAAPAAPAVPVPQAPAPAPVQPLGLNIQPPQIHVPKPMDTYLALLHHNNPLQGRG